MEQSLSDNDLWVIVLIYIGVVMAAIWANLNDPDSRTNDLEEILGLDPLSRARADLTKRLSRSRTGSAS